MPRERRIRDETGGSIYYDIDKSQYRVESGASVESDYVTGAGIFDIMKNVTTKVASKLTGKAAKKIAEKAVEKAIEKGAEKVGEKTGQLLGEKIYDKFSTTTSTSNTSNPQKGEVAPQPGDQVIKELQRLRGNQKGKKPPPSLSQQNKQRHNVSTKSISQQFDELLAL